MRAALYYAPAPDDPLWRAGCTWLGRDPENGARPPQPDLPGIAEITAEPRLYGFHATLKPPMRLASGWDRFRDDAERLAARLPAFTLPPLAVADLSGFLALRDAEPCSALQAHCDACIREMDHHRVPPDAAELLRRRGAGLSPEREAMLQRWGYPSAFGTWRFHMTLTRRLLPAERERFEPEARAHFAAALAQPRQVAELCIYTQAGPGREFMIAERLPLRG